MVDDFKVTFLIYEGDNNIILYKSLFVTHSQKVTLKGPTGLHDLEISYVYDIYEFRH